MAKDSIALRNLGMGEEVDFLREGANPGPIVDGTGGCGKIGARHHERSPERDTAMAIDRENGIPVWGPSTREAISLASLSRGGGGEQALAAVIEEAYVQGVSTRKVDDLAKAMGLTGISKSEVSRLCSELDETVEQCRNPVVGEQLPLSLAGCRLPQGAIKWTGDQHGMVVAIGVLETGEREVLGFDLGPSEDGAFWMAPTHWYCNKVESEKTPIRPR